MRSRTLSPLKLSRSEVTICVKFAVVETPHGVIHFDLRDAIAMRRFCLCQHRFPIPVLARWQAAHAQRTVRFSAISELHPCFCRNANSGSSGLTGAIRKMGPGTGYMAFDAVASFAAAWDANDALFMQCRV